MDESREKEHVIFTERQSWLNILKKTFGVSKVSSHGKLLENSKNWTNIYLDTQKIREKRFCADGGKREES